MTKQRNVLTQLSDELAAQSVAASRMTVAVRSSGRRLSGIVWQPDVVVTSEQSLATDGGCEVATADKPPMNATFVGGDPGTNVAVLRLDAALPFNPVPTADPRVGSIALVVAADSRGTANVRLALVSAVGPEWHSRAGGKIDRRIVLDASLPPTAEGGPVVAADGALLGMSTLGPRGQVLVIPSATIERIVPRLLKEGRIARGWLGIALHPVAVPENARATAGHESGMMVMSLADGGPAAKAGVKIGDILVTVGETPAAGHLAAVLDADSVGREIGLRVVRDGAIADLQATIAARP
jgi:S1-C subfamily serine protease